MDTVHSDLYAVLRASGAEIAKQATYQNEEYME